MDLLNVKCIKANTRNWGIERKHLCCIEAEEEEANPNDNAPPYDNEQEARRIHKACFLGIGVRGTRITGQGQAAVSLPHHHQQFSASAPGGKRKQAVLMSVEPK